MVFSAKFLLFLVSLTQVSQRCGSEMELAEELSEGFECAHLESMEPTGTGFRRGNDADFKMRLYLAGLRRCYTDSDSLIRIVTVPQDPTKKIEGFVIQARKGPDFKRRIGWMNKITDGRTQCDELGTLTHKTLESRTEFQVQWYRNMAELGRNALMFKMTVLSGSNWYSVNRTIADCETIKECKSDPCQHGTCQDGTDRYICVCPHGYGGTNCQIEIDEDPPEIQCPLNKTIEYGHPPPNTKATAKDSSGLDVDISFTEQRSGPPPNHKITQHWTARDSAGNTATCTTKYQFQDTTPPDITCPPNKTNIEYPEPLPNIRATAEDMSKQEVFINCSADIAGDKPTQTITQNWTARDTSNNTAYCITTYTYNDTIPPYITCPRNVTARFEDELPNERANANDSSGLPTNVSHSNTTGNFPWSTFIKQLEQVWTATDEARNTAQCTSSFIYYTPCQFVEKKQYSTTISFLLLNGTYYSDSKKDCCHRCYEEPRCVAFTWNRWNNNTCEMYRSRGMIKTDNSDATSGSIPDIQDPICFSEEDIYYSALESDVVNRTETGDRDICCRRCFMNSECRVFVLDVNEKLCHLMKTVRTKLAPPRGSKIISGLITSPCTYDEATDYHVDNSQLILIKTDVGTPQICCKNCQREVQCKAFTWENNERCTLKKAVGKLMNNNNMTSGLVLR